MPNFGMSSSPKSPKKNFLSSPKSPTRKKRELPPLFWYMESGDWEKAIDRVRRHPREVKLWATLRTKSEENRNTTKRLALHHACFKLRSAGSMPPPLKATEDPFISVCRFILVVIQLYPDAASQRETRHGCLPLHLASFATCAPRNSEAPSTGATVTTASTMSSSERQPNERQRPASPNRSGLILNAFGGTSNGGGGGGEAGTSTSGVGRAPSKPPSISLRIASDATTNTMDTAQTNMSAIHAEETYAGGMGDKVLRARGKVNVSVAFSHTMIHPKREELAVQVINALLDAYPKAIRVDSEGGRLPLHTACAGRGTPRVISTLVTAYPSAARHRNKDGFLPLHLAAHWGVSHPNVAVILLKAYPDATVGRNRWERTPLEEALCMAGENGRPHQAALVRALRKHPNYWLHSPEVFAVPRRSHQPVDIDETLPSIDTSAEDEERRYMQYGQDFMVDPEDIVERQQESLAKAPPLPPHAPSTSTPSGLLGRLTTTGSPKKTVRSNEDEETALGFSIETLIQNRRWQTVLSRIASNPLEADKDLQVQTRGGFMSQTGFTPLHYACERKPPVEVIYALLEAHPGAVVMRCLPGGCLPVHIACTWYGSDDVVTALLSVDPATAMATDELGNLPLHSACFSGADEQVILALLRANPKAVLTRNHQGSRPLDICKRLRHENRRSVMGLLTLKKEEILAQHRRNQSSGTWSEEAAEAAALNDQYDGSDRGYREGDDLQEQGIGVEVSYNDEENQELLWI